MIPLRVLKFSNTQPSQEEPPTVHAGLCVSWKWYTQVVAFVCGGGAGAGRQGLGVKVWELLRGWEGRQWLNHRASVWAEVNLSAENSWRKGWPWSVLKPGPGLRMVPESACLPVRKSGSCVLAPWLPPSVSCQILSLLQMELWIDGLRMLNSIADDTHTNRLRCGFGVSDCVVPTQVEAEVAWASILHLVLPLSRIPSSRRPRSRRSPLCPWRFIPLAPPPMLVCTLELDTRHGPRQSQPSEPLGGGDEDWVRLGRPHRTGSF